VETARTLTAALCVVLGAASIAIAEDVAVLSTGTRVVGTVTSYDAQAVTISVKVGTRNFTRKYPTDRLKSLTVGGVAIDLKTGKPVGDASQPTAATGASRSSREILDEIDRVGRVPPEWYDETPLNFPQSLDLTWPEKATGGWNSSKNVGQYVWDRINPNEGRWREGVRLMHHILSVAKDVGARERAMLSLGAMYHNLHQDYARAAFWYHQLGLDKSPGSKPNAGLNLAHCYWQLGSKPMAMTTLQKMSTKPYAAIKLLGDLGETKQAIDTAERFSKSGQASTCFLYAGDACRVAGRFDEAETYYRRAITAINPAEADKPHRKRDKARAEACIAAIRFYTLDPTKVKDGTYKSSSIGYEGQVQVEVIVKNGRIENVRVLSHREKQFYSSITETPRRIIQRQSVNGIDTTSGATITSEAIINATAKALADSRP
jgi:uncharacterized protein with FMN-binding domain